MKEEVNLFVILYLPRAFLLPIVITHIKFMWENIMDKKKIHHEGNGVTQSTTEVGR